MDAIASVKTMLDEFVAELESTDPDMFMPPERVGSDNKDEKIVANIKDRPDIRRIWVLATFHKREAMQEGLNRHFDPDKDPNDDPVSRHGAYSEWIMEVFWRVLRDELRLWGTNETIGLRFGWEIVTFKAKPGARLKRILEDLE